MSDERVPPDLRGGARAVAAPPESPATKKSDDANLEELLGGLSLGAPASCGALFQEEMDKTTFKIFEPVSDLGFFSWKPGNNAPCKSLSEVKSREEVAKNIHMDAKPPLLVDLSSLRLPTRFLSLPPQEVDNRYPHGQIDAACLHVASRKVDLDTVDFAFGGSTLEMLANRDAEGPYMATVVPHTENLILIVKNKRYTQDYAGFGFQFERLVTGGKFADRPELESIEHLHIMKVGSFKVFFRAETDAMDSNGEPVEVKASNPRYWGTKVMFQMISNASPTLCHGGKSRGMLAKASKMRLSQVARNSQFNGALLEKYILQGMQELQVEMTKYEKGEVVQISFVGGQLKTTPVSTGSSALLPPNDVVRALLT